MSKDDESNRQVGEFFGRHVRSNQKLDDIKALDALLPSDPQVLSGLGWRCLEESRKALRAGHHTEARHLEILGRQLQRRAEKTNPR